MPLTITPLQGIPLIKPGDQLAEIIISALGRHEIKLENADIIVIAQKIVSKAEGRRKHLKEFFPSSEAKKFSELTGKDPRLIEAILAESKSIIRTAPQTIIAEHKRGFICANAGIDHSNVEADAGDDQEDWILLLPDDADDSANHIRAELEQHSQKRVGVLIIDSHGRPWRLGTVGMSIGISGLPGLVDLRGRPDLFGRILRISQVATADELAAAASLMMGQADEASPVVHVRGFPYPLRESSLDELIRPEEHDLFR